MIDSYKQMAKLNESQMHLTIQTMRQDAELIRGQILQGSQECDHVQTEFELMQKTAA